MNTPVDYAAFDEVVVLELMAGRAVTRVRRADTAEATRRLARLGYTDGQIAYRLGCTRRAVWRIRVRHGIPAAVTPRDNGLTRPVTAPNRLKVAG